MQFINLYDIFVISVTRCEPDLIVGNWKFW